MSILYTGLKNRLYVGNNTTIKKTIVEEKTEEIKDLTIQINNHVDKLNDLLAPSNPHFSYIFPNYTISSISDVNLTENFNFNPDKLFEVDSMPFTHQVEVFSTLTQDLKQTYATKVQNLPEPLNSTELFPSNQTIIDRTLELAHNLPENVADTSEVSSDKLINRSIFESFSGKLASWKDEFAGFQSDFSRKTSDLVNEIKQIPSKEGQEIFNQTSIVKSLENKLTEEVTKIRSDADSEDKESLIEKSLTLNKSIEIEKAKLAQIPVPEPVEISQKIEENKNLALKYCNVVHDCVTKIESLITESYLGGKVPIVDWAKEKSPTLPEIENKVNSILDKIFNASKQNTNGSTENQTSDTNSESMSVESTLFNATAAGSNSNTYYRSPLSVNTNDSMGY